MNDLTKNEDEEDKEDEEDEEDEDEDEDEEDEEDEDEEDEDEDNENEDNENEDNENEDDKIPELIEDDDTIPELIDYDINNANETSHCWCHLCNQLAVEDFYIEHLRIHHPTTLFVLFATNMSTSRMNYVNTFPFYIDPETYNSDPSIIDDVFQQYDETGDENDDYESLLALCNFIGDHKVGIEDITAISSIADKNLLNNEDICPICIDTFKDITDDILTLNECQHSYCKGCIIKWCSENKTCPVCKICIVE